jgi:hypothetical protein
MIGFMIYLMHDLSRPYSPYYINDPFCSPFPDPNLLTPVPSQALPPPHTHRLYSTDDTVGPDEDSIHIKKTRDQAKSMSI